MKKEDWADEMLISEKEEIEIGLKQANDNQFINHDVVMKKFEKWH
jgi:hypothetical protein